jgi:hypothetical protein
LFFFLLSCVPSVLHPPLAHTPPQLSPCGSLGADTDPTALQYLTPFAAATVASHLRDWGSNVLVVYDDLTTHFQTAHQYVLQRRAGWFARTHSPLRTHTHTPKPRFLASSWLMLHLSHLSFFAPPPPLGHHHSDHRHHPHPHSLAAIQTLWGAVQCGARGSP